MKSLSHGLAIAFLLVSCTNVFGWAESGHAIITILAHRSLSAEQKAAFERIMEAHPRFAEDFAVPEELPKGIERRKWQIGRAGYWPDVARSQEEYDRPTWHYQLGAAMTMGDVSKIEVPADPLGLPADATMETQELYVLQALELCTNTLKDQSKSDAERAIALCWVVHLIGDLHLPCHSGSLYAESVFTDPDGDRGANRIEIGDLRLHGLWDQLLGNDYERGDVNRRLYELTNDKAIVERGKLATQQLDPKVWLAESRSVAQQYLYVGEVQQAVRAAIESKKTRLPKLRISDEYGQQAGRIAQVRAVEAAARLADLLEKSL